jgi:uncharacterized RDD family membrane protein YckC
MSTTTGPLGVPAGRDAAPGQPPAAPAALAYAGFGRRLLAVLLDGLILSLPAVGLGVAFFGRSGGSGSNLLLTILYEALLIALWDGRTIGKLAMGIRVVTADGRPVPVGLSFARAGMKLVSGAALGLGYLWMLWDPEKRTWHDKVAQTYVVKA